MKIWKRLVEQATGLVDVGAPNLWGHFKDGGLKACDEMCEKKRGRRTKGDIWQWNEEVKEAVSRKKESHKAICKNSTEEKKRRYKSMKNKADKAVLKAMRETAEEALSELQNCQNLMLRQVKGLKTDSKEVEGRRCMRGSDGKLCFSEKERRIVWKHYTERIMNEENDWDRNVDGDAVEGPVACVSREEVLQALNEIKTGNALGPS